MSASKEKLKNKRVVRKIFYRLKGVLKKKALLSAALKTINSFGVDIKGEDKAFVAQDMVRTFSKHGFGFDEYLCYSFHKLNEQERMEFVADWEHLGYTCALNNYKNADIFDNKWKTYSTYKDFYGRGVLFCDENTSVEDFASFLGLSEKLIIKPLDSSCGRGIKIIETAGKASDAKGYLEELLGAYNGRFIIEELICQISEMAKLHPASVNTIRIPTIRMDDEVKIVHPFMRVGQYGNFVDNAGAGGIICCVEVESGKIYAAADEKAKTFHTHPNTNEQLVGFTVPHWEEAKEFVRKLAHIIPENRYTGWDVALTEKGWVLVEANRRGQFVWQLASQEGFRKEINETLKKLKKKY